MANGNDTYHRFLYLPHWRYPARLPGVTGLYLNSIFRVLAIGLIGIFVPVFIYQISGSWQLLISFYLLTHLVVLVLTIPAAILINRLGPDLTLALAALTQFAALLSLIHSQTNLNFLWVAAIFSGITGPLHWLPYHLAFSWESTRRFLSRQLTKNAIYSRIAAALAPFAGGIIATVWGFSGLYLISGIILLLSVIPVFLDQYNRRGGAVNFAQINQTLSLTPLRPLWWGYLGTGMESAIYGIFWPLFLYECFRNLESMGLLSTISLLTSLLVLTYIGRGGEKREKTFFHWGIITSLPNWFLRSLFSSFSLLTLINTVYQITTMFVWIPVGALTYRQSRRREKSFLILRSLFINLGVVLVLAIATFVRWFNLGWRSLFLIASGGLLLVLNFRHGLKKNR